MAYYAYECEHDEQLVEHPMGTAPLFCGLPCGCRGRRVFYLPNHMEDRRHMRGERLSPATGKPYAQSRADERRLEKESGIEFVSPKDLPVQWDTLKRYAKHVKAGGERLDPHIVNPEPKTDFKGEITRKMAERGLRFG